jgi:hypothetical protein
MKRLGDPAQCSCSKRAEGELDDSGIRINAIPPQHKEPIVRVA